jgi:hypothetical protein
LKILSGILKDSNLAAIEEWPLAYGGGISCVHLIILQLLRIFNLPFSKIVCKKTKIKNFKIF